MRPWIPLILIVCAGALAGCYVTHEYREHTESPEAGEATALAAHVAVTAGEVYVRRGETTALYDLQLRYCRSHFAPRFVRRTGADGTTFGIGLRRRWDRDPRTPPGDERNVVELDLTPDLPVDLLLEVGAGRTLAQLGGLSVRTLDVVTGAGAVTIAFEEPTLQAPERFDVIGGSGGVRLLGLGHAGPAALTLAANSGQFEIDLSGPWQRDAVIDLNVRLGDVILIVPGGLGVEIVARERDPSDLILPEFTRDERGHYRGPGFAGAPRTVSIRLGPGLGVLEARFAE